MPTPDTARPRQPLVSIVIPVYNGANYLAEAIDSALGQTWPNTEVIVVDDGSDDDGATARICAGYGDRIRYFYKVNGGVATTLNYGIQVMRGEYFSWLSHDDLYTPDRIATMLEALVHRKEAFPLHESIIVFSDFEIIDEHGEHVRMVHRPCRPSSGNELAAIAGGMHGCSLLIPRKCFEVEGLLHPGLAATQDSDMWLRLRRIARFEHVRAITVRSRAHAEQGSRTPWALSESHFNKLSILDRIDSGFVRIPELSRIDLYRRIVGSGGFKARPGVYQNLHYRLACAIRAQSISLLCTGNGRSLGATVTRRLQRLGHHVLVVEMPGVEPAAIVDACRRLDTDLVWLWDKPIEAPVETLSGMMNHLAAYPEAAGCVHNAGTHKAASVLGPFQGALLSVRVFKDILSLDGGVWPALAQSIVRNGGVRRYRRGANPGTSVADVSPDSGQPSAKETALYLRRGTTPGVITGLRAFDIHPVSWGKSVIHKLCGRFSSLVQGDRNPAVSGGPTALNVLIARLGRHRLLINMLNRAVWRLSSCDELARQRLLRLHGLAGHFDPVWYARAYPEVAAAGIDPLLHYLCSGHWAGHDPSAGFSTRRYLADHPDVAAGGWHAVQHYALWGRFESRRVSRSARAELPTRSINAAEAPSTALLMICPAGVRDAARLAGNLAAQLRRSIRTVVLQVEADGQCQLHDAGSEEPGSPLPMDEALAQARKSGARRVLVFNNLDDRQDFGILLETFDMPCDVVHFGGGRSLARGSSFAGLRQLAGKASNHYALSTDVARALERHPGMATVTVVSLPDAGRLGFMRPWPRNVVPGECCRVALFGTLIAEDGLAVVIEALEIVHRYELPFVFTLYGDLKGAIPKPLRSRFNIVAVEDEQQLTDSVCRFNPHLAWIPYRHPANAVFPLADAAMSGLPIIASDSIDACNYLAGRPLSWLLPPTAGARTWLDRLNRVYRTNVPDPWTPRYPLEGFPPRDKALSEHLLESLSR